MAELERTVGALRAQLLRREAENKRRPPPAAAAPPHLPPNELAQAAQALVRGSEEEGQMAAQLAGVNAQQEARLAAVNREVAAAAEVSKRLRAAGAASTMELRALVADCTRLSEELAAVAAARQREAPDLTGLRASEEARGTQARLDALEATRQQLRQHGAQARCTGDAGEM